MTLALTLILAMAGAASPTPAMLTIADATTYAVDSADVLPFSGPAGRAGTVALLVAIAWHESGYRADVLACRTRGDRGASVSPWQLMRGMSWAGHTQAEICGSPSLAAALALRVVQLHADRCTRSGPGGWLHGYASGSCGRPSRAGRELCRDWLRAAKAAGIEGASCDVRGELTWRVAG